MTWDILEGDCLDILPTLEAESVDAMVTDPPAGIGFMGKEWDTFGSARSNPATQQDRDAAYNGVGKGAQPFAYSGSGYGDRRAFIAFLTAVMSECYRVLKPGAHAFVWAIPRTSHWTATAIEDAGFEVRDVVVHLFGSGFPKSLDVSKAIDKRRQDDVRPVCRWLRARIEESGVGVEAIAEAFGFHRRMVEHWAARDTDSQPTVPTVEQWASLRAMLGFGPEMDAEVGRLNARKGEFGEDWHARPITGEVEEWANRTNYALTARDGLRRDEPQTPEAAQWQGWGTALKPAAEHWILARKPLSERNVAANVLRWGTGAINVDGCRVEGEKAGGSGKPPLRFGGDNSRPFHEGATPRDFDRSLGRWPANVTLDEEAAALLDEQSGERPSASNTGPTNSKNSIFGSSQDFPHYLNGAPYAGETGGASRFFPVFAGDDLRFRYISKADRAERNVGLAGFAERFSPTMGDGIGGREHSPSDPRAYARNHHPTVKPVQLMQWLCRLVTPPHGLVLDPFCGSGTTGMAALREGFRFLGIEREAEYVAIARARIEGDAPLFNTRPA